MNLIIKREFSITFLLMIVVELLSSEHVFSQPENETNCRPVNFLKDNLQKVIMRPFKDNFQFVKFMLCNNSLQRRYPGHRQQIQIQENNKS
jgi:hypothetical protein